MKSKTNCSPQYNNAIEKGSGNITMILTLLMIANDSSMVLLPPVVAEAKQDDSIVTNTMSLTIDDGPFDQNRNVVGNKIKTTTINKDSGNITIVNITNDSSRVISLPVAAKNNQVTNSFISSRVTFGSSINYKPF